MFLNTLQQQQETKWNNPLNYCIFKKNHHLVIQTVCAKPSLASWSIFSPSSCCAWNLAVLKELPCCLPQTSFRSTESTLHLPALGFKAQLPALQTSDCSAAKSVFVHGEVKENHLPDLPPPSPALFLCVWHEKKLLILKEMESSSLNLLETESRIALAGQRKRGQQKLNFPFAAQLETDANPQPRMLLW